MLGNQVVDLLTPAAHVSVPLIERIANDAPKRAMRIFLLAAFHSAIFARSVVG
jgi:hypothetical protein